MLGRGSTCSFRLCWAVLLACCLWGPGDALVTAPLPSRVARPVARRLATCRSEFEGMRQGARRISRRAALQGLAAAPALLSGARRSQAEEEEGDAATSSVTNEIAAKARGIGRYKGLFGRYSVEVVPPEEGDDAAAAAAIREGINPKKRAIYLQQRLLERREKQTAANERLPSKRKITKTDEP